MAARKRTPAPEAGVLMVHSKTCGLRTEWTLDGCACNPGYRAQVYDAVTKRTEVKTFKDLKTAARWRQDRYAALRAGTARVVESITLAELREEWQNGVADGTVLAKGQRAYKDSTLREAEGIWRSWVEPTFGHVKVRELRTKHIQDAVNELIRAGRYQPSTISNMLNVLRVLLNYAVATERYVGDNPCKLVRLPSVEEAERQIVAPEVAKQLVDAIPDPVDRGLWATAFFAGLRRGELQALRWTDVDLPGRVIHVRRAFDRGITRTPEAERNPNIVGWPAVGGGAYVKPKSAAGTRRVGIPMVLMPYLAALKLAAEPGVELAFPSDTATTEYRDTYAATNRARAAWKAAGLTGYDHLTPHACRHTFASVMIAAGYNIKKVSTYMGHSKVEITWNRYGHLYPDAVAEDMGLLDEHLAERIGGSP